MANFSARPNLSATNDVPFNLDRICGSANGSPKIRWLSYNSPQIRNILLAPQAKMKLYPHANCIIADWPWCGPSLA
jgi:hypothetical protein